MLTLTLGIISSVWPEIIRPHPYWVAALALLGLLMFIFPWMRKQYLSAKSSLKGDTSPEVSPTAKVSPIITASPVISPNISPTFNVYPPQPPTQPSPQSLPPQSPEIPKLDVQFCDGTVQVDHTSVIFDESGGQRCYTVLVHNKEAEEGKCALIARSISARFTFQFPGSSSTTSVDRACWIGKVENEIYLHPGDTAHVLLGIPRNQELITYRNPNRVASRGWPSHDRGLLEIRLPLFANAHMSGEMSIIAHEKHKATTLTTRNFAIRVSDDRLRLNIQWEL